MFAAYSTPTTSPAQRFVSVGPRDPGFNIPQQPQVSEAPDLQLLLGSHIHACISKCDQKDAQEVLLVALSVNSLRLLQCEGRWIIGGAKGGNLSIAKKYSPHQESEAAEMI